jgi:hypothetical protein
MVLKTKRNMFFRVMKNWQQDRASPSGRSARKEKIPNKDFNLTKAFVTDSAESLAQNPRQFAFAG